MDDTLGEQFNATTSAGSTQAESKSEGIAAVFIEQILRSPEGYFQMWGITFNMVTVVAIVRSMESSSTKITYTLEDHTGQIEAHFWLEEDNPNKTPDLMINGYARVYGSIRQQGGKKTIMVFHMNQLTDGVNERTNHMLEVYFSRYKAEKYSQKKPNDFVIAQQDTNDNTNTTGLSPKQSAVLQAIKNYMGSDCGISYSELFKQLRIGEVELRNLIEFLVSEGIIYTTIDAEHFLIDSMYCCEGYSYGCILNMRNTISQSNDEKGICRKSLLRVDKTNSYRFIGALIQV